MFSILRPYIFSLDPEVAHDLAIKSLKANFLPKSLFEVEGEEILTTSLFYLKKWKHMPVLWKPDEETLDMACCSFQA